MKVKCQQASGTIGLNGVMWGVTKYIADVPENAARELVARHPDQFQLVQTQNKELTENGSLD